VGSWSDLTCCWNPNPNQNNNNQNNHPIPTRYNGPRYHLLHNYPPKAPYHEHCGAHHFGEMDGCWLAHPQLRAYLLDEGRSNTGGRVAGVGGVEARGRNNDKGHMQWLASFETVVSFGLRNSFQLPYLAIVILPENHSHGALKRGKK
jgi:hypothetical protein